MSAVVNRAGKIRSLDKPAEPSQEVTEDRIEDKGFMARLLMGILRDVASLLRRREVTVTDFEDVEVDSSGSTKYRFPHGFKGRVRWWPCGFRDALDSLGANLSEDADTDDNTLVLVSWARGTVDVRVEKAG